MYLSTEPSALNVDSCCAQPTGMQIVMEALLVSVYLREERNVVGSKQVHIEWLEATVF
jgi:hypothetical protein